MDKNTFGKSSASEILTQMLSEEENNKKYASSISSLLGRFQQQTRAIMDIKDIGVRRAVLEQWKLLFIEKIKYQRFPILIEGLCLNIISMFYRKLLKEIKEETGGK